jgi:riboflavin kinase/FMN adenylyltransferase
LAGRIEADSIQVELMRLFRSISALTSRPAGCRVVTIGAFDGLHLGHQEIFRLALDIARDRGDPITALSFEPTPAEYFAAIEPPARLTCFRERFEQLDALGIDELFCPHFRDINALDHQRFVRDVLVTGLGVSHIVVGHDFRYGKGRQGDIESLRAAGETSGFDVTVVDSVYHEGERVSSTRIREALAIGNLEAARQMLGRDYSMSGRVVHGLGLGRDLGFPTANINLKRRKGPVDGIFAVRVDGLGERPMDGVASVGNRPTVGGGKTLLEVFVFDFDADIYGGYITVRFIERLRSEEKFGTIEALQDQMGADVSAAKAALAKRIA